MTTITDIRGQLQGVKGSESSFTARCPAHDDRQASLSARLGDSGQILLHCHAGCTFPQIIAALGYSAKDFAKSRKPGGDIIATYDYRDADGALVFQKCRLQPKGFFIRHPDPNNPGEWINGLNGVKSRPLYRLPDLIPKLQRHTKVVVCEGEKDTDRLWSAGFGATTDFGGADTRGTKWRKEYSDLLADASHVIVLPDNDPPGRARARAICLMTPNAICLTLPGLPDHGDVSDWLDAGHTAAEFHVLVGEAIAQPPPIPELELAPAPPPVITSATPAGVQPMVPNNHPLRIAEAFLAHHYVRDNKLHLRWHAGEWFHFVGTHYEVLPIAILRAQLWRFCDGLRIANSDSLKVSPRIVSEVLDGMPSRNLIIEGDRPQWITTPPTPMPIHQLAVCQNGILHIPDRTLVPSTPELFTTTSLPFAYDPDAPKPTRWLQFLTELWPDDQESPLALRDWFGYCLTPDTRQHKILLIVGPKRAGKSTIGRLLAALIGQTAVCTPTLASLALPFGIEALLDKHLAIITDARLSGRTDSAVVVERLLSISGEDGQTIERKFNTAFNTTLRTRFVILTNELPHLNDSSGTVASRFITLTLTKSWIDNEDHELTPTLLAELPGILNWALTGFDSLTEHGRLTQPQSSRDIIHEVADLGSPVGAFVRSRCAFKLDALAECNALYDSYREWAKDQGFQNICSKFWFARDLRAAWPGFKIRQIGTAQTRCYQGIEVQFEHSSSFMS